MSTIKRFAGQTAIYGVTAIFARLLNFILTPIYVSIYPAGVYGIFTKMYSWASILNAVLAFGMETTFFRFLNKQGYNRQKVYSNTFWIVAFNAVLFFLLTFFFADKIAFWLQGSSKLSDYLAYVKYIIYILLVDALAVVPFAKVRAEERPLRYGFLKIVNILTFIGLNLFFLFVIPYIIKNQLLGADFFKGWYKQGWVGYVFLSNLIASLVTLILLLPEILKLNFSFDSKLVGQMFLYSFPVLVANISFIINENLDKILLGHLLPKKISEIDVGIYGACAKLAVFLNIFIQAFRMGAEPFFFSHSKNKNAPETYAKIMDYFVIVISLIFLGLVANIDILKYFAGGHGKASQQALYWSGLGVVPILLFAYVCLGIYMNLSIWYKLSDQTRYGLYISLVGAVLTIVLNIIFIPKYSFMASAWVTLIAYLSMMILSYILGQRNYPIPYNLRKNLFYIVIASVLVFLSFVIFNRNIILGNILFVLYLAFVVFAERKELKQLVRSK